MEAKVNTEPNSKKPYHSTEDIEALIRHFESCELSLEEFGHRAHLTVALRYLLRSPATEATVRVAGVSFPVVS